MMRALKKRAARTSLWWIQRTTRKAATMKSTRRRKKVRFNSWRGLQALLVQALPGLPAYNKIGYTKIGMNAYCRTGLGRARREGPRVRTPPSVMSAASREKGGAGRSEKRLFIQPGFCAVQGGQGSPFFRRGGGRAQAQAGRKVWRSQEGKELRTLLEAALKAVTPRGISRGRHFASPATLKRKISI